MSERTLLEQLTGNSSDIDSLREDLDRLKTQVSQNNSERNLGNPLGGPIRTEVAPGLLPIGPYRQDVDATYSLEFTLWISTELIRIRKMTLHLTPKPSRLSAGVAASSGTLTSAAGGSTTVTSGNGGSHTSSSNPEGQASVAATTGTHNHRWAVFVSAPAVLPAGATYQRYNTYDSAAGLPGTPQQFDISILSGTLGYTGAPLAGAGGSATVSVAPAAHTHDVTIPDHTHGVTIGTHTHDISGHTHTITLSISETGMANNLHLWIDGVDRTVLLGGPWTAATDIVLTQNQLQAVGLTDVRLNPVTGGHVIKVTSTAAGAVEVVGDYSVIIKAVQ